VNECFNVGAFEVKFDVSAIRGARPHMEDRWAVARHPDEDEPYVLFAVFDGHGGDAVSSFLAKRFSETLFDTNLRNLLRDDPQEALRRACRACDEEIVSLFPKPNGFRSGPGPGSTAVVALYCLTETNPSAYVACVGDSRCVAADEHGCVVFETVDQRPSRVEERARVEALGGTVRVVGGVARAAGVLAVSRAFGNAGIKACVKAEPEVSSLALEPPLNALKEAGERETHPCLAEPTKRPPAVHTVILCSDGLTDVVASDRAAEATCARSPGLARRGGAGASGMSSSGYTPTREGDARGDARAAFGAAAFVLGAVRGDARDAGRERGDPRGSGDARGRGRLVGLAPRRRRADVAGQDAPERRQRVRLSVPRAPEGDEPLPAGAGGAGGGSGDAENHAGEDSG
jgi:serine/threonine protein phosphatase PrpC